MSRDLLITTDNILKMIDPIEKTEVVFTHRTPETDDRVRFMVAKFKRDGDRLIDRTRSALIDAAASVLTGIRTGDFTIGGQPLSSTPGEEGYREDWKELIKAAAGDLLFLMGHELFDGRISLPDGLTTNIVSEFDTEETPAEEAGPIPPLESSSGD